MMVVSVVTGGFNVMKRGVLMKRGHKVCKERDLKGSVMLQGIVLPSVE